MTKTAAEVNASNIEAQAKKILKQSDGLQVLKPGTVGYIVALGAVENALALANSAALEQVGYFINITESDKPTDRWDQAAEEFKDNPDVIPLYRQRALPQ